MNIIDAKKIIKTYKTGSVETEVLKGVDFEVKEGEWVAIMGMSGAGKSTLMYQIGLLDYPTGGNIKIEGKDILSMTDTDRTNFRLDKLGYIFQDYALLPELDALENVMVPLIMQGRSTEESKKLAALTLSKLGLGDRLKNKPSQLSGGEQQRVSIARAVAKNPKILFADEPTANLDSVSSEGVISTLKDLHEEGQTIVMVTHEYEYTKYCDRVFVMSDGLIIKEKKPQKKISKKETAKKKDKKLS
ncbi:MAG: putative ABC transport system ATP-binding protein [Candidatus Paceibacteria bacterium]|jgi:putative ABC transport system ATP-binding protein